MLQAVYNNNTINDNDGDEKRHKKNARKQRRDGEQNGRRMSTAKEFEVTMHLMASLAMSGVDPHPVQSKNYEPPDESSELLPFELSQRFRKDFPKATAIPSNEQLRQRYREEPSSPKPRMSAPQPRYDGSRSPRRSRKSSKANLQRMTTPVSSSSNLRRDNEFSSNTSPVPSSKEEFATMFRDHLGLPKKRITSSENLNRDRKRIDIDAMLADRFRDDSKPTLNTPFPTFEHEEGQEQTKPRSIGLRAIMKSASTRSFGPSKLNDMNSSQSEFNLRRISRQFSKPRRIGGNNHHSDVGLLQKRQQNPIAASGANALFPTSTVNNENILEQKRQQLKDLLLKATNKSNGLGNSNTNSSQVSPAIAMTPMKTEGLNRKKSHQSDGNLRREISSEVTTGGILFSEQANLETDNMSNKRNQSFGDFSSIIKMPAPKRKTSLNDRLRKDRKSSSKQSSSKSVTSISIFGGGKNNDCKKDKNDIDNSDDEYDHGFGDDSSDDEAWT